MVVQVFLAGVEYPPSTRSGQKSYVRTVCSQLTLPPFTGKMPRYKQPASDGRSQEFIVAGYHDGRRWTVIFPQGFAAENKEA